MTGLSELTEAGRAFLDGLPFVPDPFQIEALAAVELGESVVVTAPTGAGKTLVAEGAIDLALGREERAFYTAPIKALSNQKYSDFVAVYGAERVGLLTGDNVVNPDGDLIVMTTEVLRNMIYAGSSALNRLGVVVLDEVHYLQDRYRGPVWEEVIIHLPGHIPLVNLSATISNAAEFAAWIESRRGATSLVTETRRPVPLESMYLLSDRFDDYRLEMLPVFGRGGRPNQQIVKMLKRGRGRRRRYATPRRTEVAAFLTRHRLVPAIYFIFSRAGCDRAASIVAAESRGLTSEEDRAEIEEITRAAVAHVPERDLAALGFEAFLERLRRGVAAHHAGMVPAFKETVEALFVRGLVKIVFATETLSLGINMPARAVVLEQMSKFNGETHQTLTRGEFTQLTGRAGRRGIDERGTAVVLHDGRLPFERVASVAAPGSEPMRSSFQPSYNMAVNLIANYDRDRAEELLDASFAQFRAEQRRAGLEGDFRRRTEEIAELRAGAACDRGDVWEYARRAGGFAANPERAGRAFLQRTRIGDVITLDGEDRWVLLARSWGASPRLMALSETGNTRRIEAKGLARSFAILGSIELPEPVRSRDEAYHARAALLLQQWAPDDVPPQHMVAPGLREDPVGSCPDIGEHLRLVRRVERAEREVRKIERRMKRTAGTMVAAFRATAAVLEARGYTDGWRVTEPGQRLRYVYNERDLLLAETVEAGLCDGLDAPQLAALVSGFTFDPRADDAEDAWPQPEVAAAASGLITLWEDLVSEEDRRGVPLTRRPEGGFAAAAHAWASGVDLEDLLDPKRRVRATSCATAGISSTCSGSCAMRTRTSR